MSSSPKENRRSSFFRGRHKAKNSQPSHNNSQHVLAIVAHRKPQENYQDVGSTIDVPTQESILQAFSKTSDLPIDVWRHDAKQQHSNISSNSIMDPLTYVVLASNYPNCILESENFCVLSAGFPYHYQAAFGEDSLGKSFSRTVLDYCESLLPQGTDIAESMGQCLKKVSGHFSLYLVRKGINGNMLGFWAWNDPFGFMPVYHHHLGEKAGNTTNSKCENSTTVLSSHWDCIVPALVSRSTRSKLQLDWDVVAEYLTLGTTLGGERKDCESMDRTFVEGIHNLCPGTCLSITSNIASDDATGKHPTRTTNSYTDCYGACEEMLCAKPWEAGSNNPTASAESSVFLSEQKSSAAIHHIRGVKLAEKKNDKKESITPLPFSTEKSQQDTDDADSSSSSMEQLLLEAMFGAFFGCIEQAVVQGHVGRAALTGGGDTRLILACLLLLRRAKEKIITTENLVFQTHSKQQTDWQIARHLTTFFGLKHEKIRATSTTIEGAYDFWSLFSREEVLLSNLHDQTPLRRTQKKACDKHKEDCLSYTLHGRFGTEFLGCLCFDKSPLDVRRDEIEGLRPKATQWFRTIFGSSSGQRKRNSIRNPIVTLQERFDELEEDKVAMEKKAAHMMNEPNNPPITFDASYAFQLQLYTRSCLSDIYKGLRGGSWFSIPTAQFSRNAITPFLDNTLLKLIMCCVSVRDKEEPYELYGKLYSNNKNKSTALEILNKVPSNNKLLCNHTTIPRAMKASEATARPFQPKLLQSSMNVRQQNCVQTLLQNHFDPVFWKGAVALIATSPVKINPKAVQGDLREDVRALLKLVGNAHDACLLSGRLQSFLLWYERRFLVHTHHFQASKF